MKPNSFARLIYIIFELDFVGKGGPNLLEPYGRHDLSDFGVHPLVLDVFSFSAIFGGIFVRFSIR